MTKVISRKELHARLQKKTGFNKAYKALEFEFKLHEELNRARIEKGLTQKDLANKMGTQQSAIARFESGRGNPTIDFIRRMSKALGLKVSIIVQ